MSPGTAMEPAVEVRVDVARPILIVGVGRSGTSLVQSMLAAHPEVDVLPETHLYRRYVAPVVRRGGGQVDARALELMLARDEDFARAGIAPERIVPAGRAQCDPRGVYERLLREHATRARRPRVGDKDPRNLDCLRELAASLPSARVVHVIRDPRDVVLSRTKAAWSAGRPWWLHALLVQAQLARGRRAGREAFGDGYFELRYEDLLADPEGSLRRFCEHAAIPYDPAMLQFGDAARRLVDERERAWKEQTLGPLLRDNGGAWREELSPAQVRWIEAVCGEAFDALGYERLGDRGDRDDAGGRAEVSRPLRWLAPVVARVFEVVYGVREGVTRWGA